MDIHTTIVYPDIHTPHHDEPTIKALLSFTKALKPDRIIQLGDFCDFNSMTNFDLHHIKEFCYLEDELAAANLMLDRIESVLPRKCESF